MDILHVSSSVIILSPLIPDIYPYQYEKHSTCKTRATSVIESSFLSSYWTTNRNLDIISIYISSTPKVEEWDLGGKNTVTVLPIHSIIATKQWKIKLSINKNSTPPTIENKPKVRMGSIFLLS